ncbi:MAG TPA: VOC family protein [Gammaproteobacteria bacterium]|jgi:uncharacterized glyoxalase superfamily protein PhnB
MRFQKVMPVLVVKDVARAVAFYGQLGFQVTKQMEGWATLAHGEVEIMFSLPNDFMRHDQPLLTGALYFKVDDVAPLWEKMKDAAKLSYALQDFGYGTKEFAIFDPDGYLIQFAQEI